MVDGKRKKLNSDKDDELLTQKTDIKSKYYVDGEEMFSEDSYLFKWKPGFINQKNEEYWDSQKDKFACSRSGTLKKTNEENKEEEDKDEEDKEEEKKSYNKEIIRELEKLLKYYEAEGDKGRSFGYRKALTFLRSY